MIYCFPIQLQVALKLIGTCNLLSSVNDDLHVKLLHRYTIYLSFIYHEYKDLLIIHLSRLDLYDLPVIHLSQVDDIPVIYYLAERRRRCWIGFVQPIWVDSAREEPKQRS